MSALQRDGLIARAPDPTDGRGTVISPTPAGLQRMAAVQAARTRLYGDMLADWTPRTATTAGTLEPPRPGHGPVPPTADPGRPPPSRGRVQEVAVEAGAKQSGPEPVDTRDGSGRGGERVRASSRAFSGRAGSPSSAK